ncbi:hypothetical protein PPACK8108_LOCUS10325 [Phakopsora pachyrhizi]|uniref:Secreted protein n=1 Tax=Phakopsora pachyrhizi TaxID=170000 RepID=A0A0S1MIY5_PHAPC|nr:hypothetical protein PPACK8108_LOCUS10036 [Phakopsora pachyrhizi]CAH7675330.1 hypothetical protein PPACK8108_LOCUS10325 [Phakopsora pachyrhizi]
MMAFNRFAYLLLVSIMVASFTTGQLLPSAYKCNSVDSSRFPINREDCRDSLNLFLSPRNVLTFANGNTQSCGTCRVTIIKSGTSAPPRTAQKSWAVTALHEGYDNCNGNPVTATIGDSAMIDVSLSYGNGTPCPP